METKSTILFLATLITLWACNKNRETDNLARMDKGEAAESMVEEMPPVHQEVLEPIPPTDNASPATSGTQNSTIVPAQKKIIKDGTMSIRSSDINASKKFFDGLIRQYDSYYENEELKNYDQSVSYDLIIRIPAGNFEKLISAIENGKDEIQNKNIEARDVTEEFVDIESRLANKKEYLKRYKELLSRAATVKDILAIEETIRSLQEEIESKEGRLKFLNDRVAFSILKINLYQEKEFVYKPKPQDSFLERIKNSIGLGWMVFVNLIVWIVSIWPILIMAVVIVYILKRAGRNRKNKQ